MTDISAIGPKELKVAIMSWLLSHAYFRVAKEYSVQLQPSMFRVRTQNVGNRSAKSILHTISCNCSDPIRCLFGNNFALIFCKLLKACACVHTCSSRRVKVRLGVFSRVSAHIETVPLELPVDLLVSSCFYL